MDRCHPVSDAHARTQQVCGLRCSCGCLICWENTGRLSSAGTAHALNDNTDVPRCSEIEQKSQVNQSWTFFVNYFVCGVSSRENCLRRLMTELSWTSLAWRGWLHHITQTFASVSCMPRVASSRWLVRSRGCPEVRSIAVSCSHAGKYFFHLKSLYNCLVRLTK